MPTHKIDREMEPELYVCASWLQLFNDLLTKTASGQHLRWYKWHHKNAALLSFEERILNEFSNDLFTKQEILEKERIHLQNLRKILLQRCIFWVTLITNIKEKKGVEKMAKAHKAVIIWFFDAALKSPTLLVIPTLKNSVKKWFETLKPNFW